MTATIQEIEARQAELAAMIEQLRAAQPISRNLHIPGADIELAAGEIYAGMLIDADACTGHHIVLLPGAGAGLTWDQAQAWAASVGGALPTRREQSLLFANAKQHFEEDWYWSGEEHAEDGSFAWGQGFHDGNQRSSHKSYEGRARAVRRIQA